MSRVAWADGSAGVSGDMLLGALTALRVLDPTELPRRLRVEATVEVNEVRRGGLAATQVIVTPADQQPARTLPDVLAILDGADLPSAVRNRAAAVFGRLATAEAAVHGTTPESVHFHEVGAVDAIIDIAGACMGLDALDITQLIASPISVGGGHAHSAHGRIPVPAPAVVQLLAGSGLEAAGGPVDVELATPTGVAVLAEWTTNSGPMPAMSVEQSGTGAGGRELDGVPNVMRLVVGEAAATVRPQAGDWSVVEANVDDLDPRLWPVVLQRLMSAGAADAWLTPILMKKGRPAHTVSALCPAHLSTAVRDCLLQETSTIGSRVISVDKHELRREWISINVAGQAIRVKLAWDGAERRNAVPEFDDVIAAAKQLGRPVKDVLAAAIAAGHAALADPTG